MLHCSFDIVSPGLGSMTFFLPGKLSVCISYSREGSSALGDLDSGTTQPRQYISYIKGIVMMR